MGTDIQDLTCEETQKSPAKDRQNFRDQDRKGEPVTIALDWDEMANK